jgi:membrane-associated phospholipid phosphatase
MTFSYSNQFKERSAHFISTATNAPLVAIPVFFLINYFLLEGPVFIMVTGISIFFAGVMPIIISLLWIKNKKIEIDMPKREDRPYPLLMVSLSYLVGAALLYAFQAPPITTVLMFCYFSNTIIVLLISLFWKISIHSMGVAGPATAMIYVFGYAGLIFALIVPLVMWSRTYLKRHTLSQVMVGALLGFLFTAAQIYIFLGP